MKKEKEKIQPENFYRCVCGDEVLMLDSTYFKLEGELYLSMLKHYNDKKLNFWEKLGIWKDILKDGYPYRDQIMLQEAQVRELHKQLGIELSKIEDKK